LRDTAEEPLSLDELLALLASVEKGDAGPRNHAIACALSASEGWEEAVKLLGGAFAEESPGLKERKDDLPED
jgi:hypothetical protein